MTGLMRNCLAATAALALVAGVPAPIRAAHARVAAAVPLLTWKQLQNLTYPSTLSPTGKITLHNGSYSYKAGYDELYAGLFKVHAYGDLNSDRVPDAVVTTWESGGGTGDFFTLVAVLDRGGKPVVVAHANLGDRPDVKTLAISHGTITLKMNYAGPRAGACCPDTATVMTFALAGTKLKLLKQVDTPLPASN